MGLPHWKHGSVAIPDGQNLRQKLQALVAIKLQISIHQKKALSNDHHWSLRTPLMQKLLAFLIYNFKKWKTAGIHDFSQRAANGTLIALVACVYI